MPSFRSVTHSPLALGRAYPSLLHAHPDAHRYAQHVLLNGSTVLPARCLHLSAVHFDEDKSKVEKTVKLLKKDQQPEVNTALAATATIPMKASDTALVQTAPSTVVKRKSLPERIVHELKHYYNGFKLLFIETKIASRLLRQVLQGHTLTRRERKQVRPVCSI